MRMKCTRCGEWWGVSARVKAEPGRYVCMVCKAEEDRAVADKPICARKWRPERGHIG